MDSPSAGTAEFDRDWTGAEPPVLSLGGPPLKDVARAPALAAAGAFRYFLEGEVLSFVLPLAHGTDVDPRADKVYVAGDFNGWQQGVGLEDWELKPAEIDGEPVLRWTGPAGRIHWPKPQAFKFVTGEHQWLAVPSDAPNAVDDGRGGRNRLVDPQRTGRHLWRFGPEAPLDLAERWSLSEGQVSVPLGMGPFFFELGTDVPLGALPGRDETVFRLFAPRARGVTLFLGLDAAAPDAAHRFALSRRADFARSGVWEVTLDQNLHGWAYWYQVDGVRDGPGRFDPAARVLDPYARAAVDRGGPGLVLEASWFDGGDGGFRPPAWQDLVIAEAHVRDLAAQAPIEATPEERRGFTGLRRWVESPAFYLDRLGVNCVELQPLQEFDNATPEEYHWGYMTNNYFAPESSYSLAPAAASGVRELQELVAALHRKGIAVVLDVVYNHVGVPEHLALIDRTYYFEHDGSGQPTNWSGCGNDLRARSAMARRLIIDSCRHLLQAYGVDGFRFDLAELLGVEVLRDIETALKRTKPGVILIAEPWSFRGHIAGALRDTGWASWNDGYRDFVRDYVRGNGPAERLEYYLKGSPWYYAKWPAQTVNYTESHDDRTWIDAITENPGNNGFVPTENDRRRTHLMAAILFMSVGIPMLSAGQDFLRSKHGVNNTYQRGDLNALDYHLLEHRSATHAYFADWIAFRRGPFGRLLRQFSRPAESFFEFYRPRGWASLAAIYNADRSAGPVRLLFAVNPTTEEVALPLGEESAGSWRQLADRDRFLPSGEGRPGPLGPGLVLPPLGCGLWVSQ
jgi:pullulanase/glycogen debranching enzyme